MKRAAGAPDAGRDGLAAALQIRGVAAALQIDGLVARYTPDIAAQITACRRKLYGLVPRGHELVYDTYNALAFGFAWADKASAAIVSVAAYPRWVTLFFLHGAQLQDADGLLEGTGSRVRSIRLASPDDLDDPKIRTLITQALAPHAAALALAPPTRAVLKSVAAKQRPRQPAAPLAPVVPAWRLRDARADDLALTYAITRDAMRSYVEQTWGPWDEAEQQHKHQQSFTPQTHGIVIVGDAAAGLVAVEELHDHLWLVKLYLLSACRGQGIGTALLRAVLQHAQGLGKPVRLRVLRVNVRAQALYARHGFRVVAQSAERFFMERPVEGAEDAHDGAAESPAVHHRPPT